MRLAMLLLAALLAGCTAMLLGGGNSPAQGERSAAVAATDDRTTAAVRERFGADSLLGRYSLGVSTYRGRVTLTGSVDNYDARDRAGALARRVPGVTGVDNRIRVRQ